MGLRTVVSGRYAGWVCVAAVAVVSGCGQFFPPLSSSTTGTGSTGSGTGSAADYIYAGNLATDPYTIAGFSLASSALSSLSGSPYDIGTSAEPTALTIYGNYLYMSSAPSIETYAYPIESDGTLGTGVAAGSLGPTALQVDTTGKWLIGVDTTLGEIYAFGLDSSNGTLTQPLSTSTVSLTNCNETTNLDGLPPGIAITPTDDYIYVSCGTGGIYTFSFNSTSGAITQVNSVLNPAKTDGADFGLAVNPSGNLLFAAETLSGVRVFTIDSTNGTLSGVSGSPFATGSGPSAVLVDSTGSYLYVANRTDGTISGYLVTNSGALTAIAGSPFSTGIAPIALAEDNSHTYIVAVCSGGTTGLETYTLSSTTPGALVSFKTASTGSGDTGAYSLAVTR